MPRLPHNVARIRLADHDHGVLGTMHADRGVDAVPVVFAFDDGFVGIPLDRVKPKTSSRLQRERNLEADPRATLLVEHWDREDWSKLWWVRAELQWQNHPTDELTSTFADLLAARYYQYRDQPFERILVFQVSGLTGWSATAAIS